MKTGAGGVSFEETAKRMLRYRENNEDLNVGVTELPEQLEILEEAGISIKQVALQARNEKRPINLLLCKGKNMFALPAWPDGTRSCKVWLNWKDGVEIRCRK